MIVQAAVRADSVVVLPPGFDEMTSVVQCHEPVLVEAFVPELAVKTFGITVFGGFARGDVMPLNAVILRPLQYGTAGKLRTVVTDDTVGFAMLFDEPVEFPHHPGTADGRIYGQYQAFTGALVHHAKDAEAASIR